MDLEDINAPTDYVFVYYRGRRSALGLGEATWGV